MEVNNEDVSFTIMRYLLSRHSNNLVRLDRQLTKVRLLYKSPRLDNKFLDF